MRAKAMHMVHKYNCALILLMRDMHQAIDKSRITFINRERIALIFQKDNRSF